MTSITDYRTPLCLLDVENFHLYFIKNSYNYTNFRNGLCILYLYSNFRRTRMIDAYGWFKESH